MAIASVKPAISHAVANRATGSTIDGMPVVQRMSTPVAVPSIGMRGRGDFSSATHAATAHTIAAQPAGLSTRPRPQPSSASRLVVAAAIGSSATAISAKIGESQRKMPTSTCAGGREAGGRGGPGTGGSAVVGGSAASWTTGMKVVAGSDAVARLSVDVTAKPPPCRSGDDEQEPRVRRPRRRAARRCTRPRPG